MMPVCLKLCSDYQVYARQSPWQPVVMHGVCMGYISCGHIPSVCDDWKMLVIPNSNHIYWVRGSVEFLSDNKCVHCTFRTFVISSCSEYICAKLKMAEQTKKCASCFLKSTPVLVSAFDHVSFSCRHHHCVLGFCGESSKLATDLARFSQMWWFFALCNNNNKNNVWFLYSTNYKYILKSLCAVFLIFFINY